MNAEGTEPGAAETRHGNSQHAEQSPNRPFLKAIARSLRRLETYSFLMTSIAAFAAAWGVGQWIVESDSRRLAQEAAAAQALLSYMDRLETFRLVDSANIAPWPPYEGAEATSMIVRRMIELGASPEELDLSNLQMTRLGLGKFGDRNLSIDLAGSSIGHLVLPKTFQAGRQENFRDVGEQRVVLLLENTHIESCEARRASVEILAFRSRNMLRNCDFSGARLEVREAWRANRQETDDQDNRPQARVQGTPGATREGWDRLIEGGTTERSIIYFSDSDFTSSYLGIFGSVEALWSDFSGAKINHCVFEPERVVDQNRLISHESDLRGALIGAARVYLDSLSCFEERPYFREDCGMREPSNEQPPVEYVVPFSMRFPERGRGTFPQRRTDLQLEESPSWRRAAPNNICEGDWFRLDPTGSRGPVRTGE